MCARPGKTQILLLRCPPHTHRHTDTHKIPITKVSSFVKVRWALELANCQTDEWEVWQQVAIAPSCSTLTLPFGSEISALQRCLCRKGAKAPTNSRRMRLSIQNASTQKATASGPTLDSTPQTFWDHRWSSFIGASNLEEGCTGQQAWFWLCTYSLHADPSTLTWKSFLPSISTAP